MKTLTLTLAAACLLLAGCASMVGAVNRAYAPNWALSYLPELGQAFPKEKALAAHPEWSERSKAAIQEGTVFIGMSKAEVLASWGAPLHRNQSAGKGWSREQWVYRYSTGGPTNYLYFGSDGLLEASQTSG